MTYLSVSEAAEQLGVTPGRIKQYVTAGDLPRRIIGRMLFFTPGELARFRRPPRGRKPAKNKAKSA